MFAEEVGGCLEVIGDDVCLGLEGGPGCFGLFFVSFLVLFICLREGEGGFGTMMGGGCFGLGCLLRSLGSGLVGLGVGGFVRGLLVGPGWGLSWWLWWLWWL